MSAAESYFDQTDVVAVSADEEVATSSQRASIKLRKRKPTPARNVIVDSSAAGSDSQSVEEQTVPAATPITHRLRRSSSQLLDDFNYGSPFTILPVSPAAASTKEFDREMEKHLGPVFERLDTARQTDYTYSLTGTYRSSTPSPSAWENPHLSRPSLHKFFSPVLFPFSEGNASFVNQVTSFLLSYRIIRVIHEIITSKPQAERVSYKETTGLLDHHRRSQFNSPFSPKQLHQRSCELNRHATLLNQTGLALSAFSDDLSFSSDDESSFLHTHRSKPTRKRFQSFRQTKESAKHWTKWLFLQPVLFLVWIFRCIRTVVLVTTAGALHAYGHFSNGVHSGASLCQRGFTWLMQSLNWLVFYSLQSIQKLLSFCLSWLRRQTIEKLALLFKKGKRRSQSHVLEAKEKTEGHWLRSSHRIEERASDGEVAASSSSSKQNLPPSQNLTRIAFGKIRTFWLKFAVCYSLVNAVASLFYKMYSVLRYYHLYALGHYLRSWSDRQTCPAGLSSTHEGKGASGYTQKVSSVSVQQSSIISKIWKSVLLTLPCTIWTLVNTGIRQLCVLLIASISQCFVWISGFCIQIAGWYTQACSGVCSFLRRNSPTHFRFANGYVNGGVITTTTTNQFDAADNLIDADAAVGSASAVESPVLVVNAEAVSIPFWERITSRLWGLGTRHRLQQSSPQFTVLKGQKAVASKKQSTAISSKSGGRHIAMVEGTDSGIPDSDSSDDGIDQSQNRAVGVGRSLTEANGGFSIPIGRAPRKRQSKSSRGVASKSWLCGSWLPCCCLLVPILLLMLPLLFYTATKDEQGTSVSDQIRTVPFLLYNKTNELLNSCICFASSVMWSWSWSRFKQQSTDHKATMPFFITSPEDSEKLQRLESMLLKMQQQINILMKTCCKKMLPPDLSGFVTQTQLTEIVDSRLNLQPLESRISKLEGLIAATKKEQQFVEEPRFIELKRDVENLRLSFIEVQLSFAAAAAKFKETPLLISEVKAENKEQLQNEIAALKFELTQLIEEKQKNAEAATIVSEIPADRNDEFETRIKQLESRIGDLGDRLRGTEERMAALVLDVGTLGRVEADVKELQEELREQQKLKADFELKLQAFLDASQLQAADVDALRSQILALQESEFMLQKENESSTTSSVPAAIVPPGTSLATLDDVQRLIAVAIAKFDADKTGIVDHALEPAGGTVLSTRCTEEYKNKYRVLKVWGIPLWYTNYSPRTVIQPGVVPGECWAFVNQGYLVVQLSGTVHISSFSYEHIPVELAPDNHIDSAPKEFEVLGLLEENDKQPVVLGSFVYKKEGPPLQVFPVQNSDARPFPIIELRVRSNHGHPLYTCLYRFRVHGKRVFPGYGKTTPDFESKS